MIWLTDIKTDQKVAVNPEHIVVVFEAVEGEFTGYTFVGLISGNLVVKETDIDVVGMIEGTK